MVFDFETDSRDATTCSAVQLAAIVIDPRNLNIVPNSEINLFMRPDLEKSNKDTIAWHGERLKLKPEQVIELWKTYPDPKVVWPEFLKYTRKYHLRQNSQSKHTAPISAGANIKKFDLTIVERYHTLYGDKKDIFSPRDCIDLIDWFFPWFENNGDVNSFSMDNMRDYFGMSKDNAHDALQDVKDSAELIIRFLKLNRLVAEKVKFKGAFKR